MNAGEATEAGREPIGFRIAPIDSPTWQGRLIVVCDDGTVWGCDSDGKWWEWCDPIPGTRAALAALSPSTGGKG